MTMNPDDPPEPVALLEAGCGASDPGACAEASAFGLTWVCTARLSRDEVTCWDDELIRDWPLIASICCLLWSLASRVLSCVQAIEPGSIPQSVLTFAWSLATVVASAWLVAFTEATVSL